MPKWPRLLPSCLLIFFVFAFFMWGTKSFAHPLSPSLWDWVEKTPGQVSVTWKTPSAKIPGENLMPHLPSDCQTLHTEAPIRSGTFWLEQSELQCSPDWITQTFTVDGLATSHSNIILKIQLADQRHFETILNAGTTAFAIPERASENSIFQTYLPLGFHHILSGWDHLLFVLGLFLLIRPSKKLLWAITAFTLGHSLTLSLAVLQLATMPSQLTEVLIAVSILVLALELLQQKKTQATFFYRHAWLMAFGFGLLHGMGFAGALAEVGLPRGEIPLALLSFNVGIESGQLCFIAGLWLIWKTMQKVPMPALLRRIEIPAYVIGSLAAFWIFERLGFIFNKTH